MNRSSIRSALILIIVISLVYMGMSWYSDRTFRSSEIRDYTMENLESDAKAGKIDSLGISQNSQVPTGTVTVIIGQDTRKLNVTN